VVADIIHFLPSERSAQPTGDSVNDSRSELLRNLPACPPPPPTCYTLSSAGDSGRKEENKRERERVSGKKEGKVVSRKYISELAAEDYLYL
jgi:hypothetical protein